MYLLVLLVFLSTISCAGKKESRSSEGSATIIPAYDTSKYAIIPFDEKQTYLFRNARPADLAARDIKSIESLLSDAILEYNKGVKGEYQVKPLEKYKRQLVAVINEKGEKEVFVNCFCAGNPYFTNWRKELVMVDDGGSCFFSVKINLSAKKTYDLMVNGIG